LAPSIRIPNHSVIVDERTPTLLVIEDAQDQAILVGVAARNALPGLEVHIAGDGQQGIDFLAGIQPHSDPPTNPTPDLIILDLRMPEVDGFGVLEWLEDHGGSPCPVVVFTSRLTPENEKRALGLGAKEACAKPASLDELGSTVFRIVTRWIRPGDMIAAHLRQLG